MRFKFSPLAAALCATGLMLWAGPALSYTYFYTENFQSTPVGNNVPTGWSQTERDANDVGIINLSSPYNHVLQLRDFIPGTNPSVDALAATTVISTVGWEDVVLKFDWKGHGTEYGDKLYVDLKIGSDDWVNLVYHSLSSSDWDTDTIALDSDAWNTTIELRFWTDVSELSKSCSGYGYHKKTCSYPQSDEAAKIDNVKLKGNPLPPNAPPPAVPIPGALPLFASGLVLVGFLAHRRRRRG